MKILFRIPGEPRGKARPRVVRTKAGRSMTYTPDKTVAYEELVRQRFSAAAAGRRFAEGEPMQLEITAFYTVPKSASRRVQTEMFRERRLPLKKPDLDNIMKIVCDALNGVAYKDDAQITDAALHKRWSAEPEVWVTLTGKEAKEDESEGI